MSLRSDIEKILTVAGVVGTDVDRVVCDEHARYQLYLDVLSLVSSSKEFELVATILRDPDGVMAESAVVAHVDRKASVLNSRSSYDAWVTQVIGPMGKHEFLVRRIEEWRLFKGFMEGDAGGVDALRDASDWLQRKVSQEATSRAVLEKLAEVGRTKRVRNMAVSRSQQLG